jgi:hypothetical protein
MPYTPNKYIPYTACDQSVSAMQKILRGIKLRFLTSHAAFVIAAIKLDDSARTDNFLKKLHNEQGQIAQPVHSGAK